ncbi:MAG: hypothetical protein GF334_01060 [Candidatus Altiarchaeales archaeon]|nr:hypothetical protein [Candidatus Altiarchaeales archaeon]
MTDSIYYDRPNKNPGQGLFHFIAAVIGTLLILAMLLGGFVGLCAYVNGLDYVERGAVHLREEGYRFDKLSYVANTEEYYSDWQEIHKLKAKNLRGPLRVRGDAYIYMAFDGRNYEEIRCNIDIVQFESIN